MQRVYLSGHHTFDNRGCEAIVRSTVARLREVRPGITVIVPSSDIARDRRQWPDAAGEGVEFVPAFRPWQASYWVRIQALPFAALKRVVWPFPIPRAVRAQIAAADAVLAVGGDLYSLDYRIPTPKMALDRLAMQMGKPVCLWGASVGPFEGVPDFVPTMTRHLAGMKRIFVRESVSHDYLTGTLGLGNVAQMPDPAFTLEPREIDLTPFWPEAGKKGVIGLNVSPLIERYAAPGQDLAGEVTAFVRDAAAAGYGIVLVPHVAPLDGTPKNSDAHHMRRILAAVADLGGQVTMVPDGLNAVQLKHVLGQLRFFIGARTHATIGALSSGVPTVSIAYSVKAIGINRDLFGDDEVVLPTPEVSRARLSRALGHLETHEDALRAHLVERMPDYRRRVAAAARAALG